MKMSDLLSSGYTPPLAPPPPRMDAKGIVRPVKKQKPEITDEDRAATVAAEDRRMMRRIKMFHAHAPGPVINLGDLLKGASE